MTNDSFPLYLDGSTIANEKDLIKHHEDGALMNTPESVRFIVIHCTATRTTTNYTVERLMHDHKARGFRTIGYHFYIRRDGTHTQHRKLLEVGAHARPYNRCSIGICYEGGLDDQGRPRDTRTPQQKETILHLLYEMKRLFPNAEIVGHRDLPGTTPKLCPCFDARRLNQEVERYMEGNELK